MTSKSTKPLKPHFYRVELNKTDWELPDRYQKLSPVGSGAYGQVWYVELCFDVSIIFVINLVSALCYYICTVLSCKVETRVENRSKTGIKFN